jgi:polyferredoxin
MSDKWVRDTGLVFALLFLLLGIRGSGTSLIVSLVFLLVVLFAPATLTPLAWAWFKVAEGLGFVMNKVFFGLVFCIVIVPVGLLRRLLQGDARDLKNQPEKSTALHSRDHVVVAADLVHPF